ncbi:hypothetical protein AG1IA_09543 [Rhizoctonia solani AG-1 IA]|uniref:Uncharacterized protein n=1 Tax=Thanatephorus cucumeris (strain AG1-IA) TaxID=983506 RepID=L8WE23_THACA|nr:hypothetical protein AG1IA_09543 [Rhizoctonia solani AG-1 IA]
MGYKIEKWSHFATNKDCVQHHRGVPSAIMKIATYTLGAVSILAADVVSVPVTSHPDQRVFAKPASVGTVKLIQHPKLGSYLCRSNDERGTWSHQQGVDTYDNHVVNAINQAISQKTWGKFSNNEKIKWENKECNVRALYKADIGEGESWGGRSEYRVVFSLPEGSSNLPSQVHFCGVMSHVGDRPKNKDFGRCDLFHSVLVDPPSVQRNP